MKHSKISITILSMLLFGNSLNCLSASQRRTLKRPKNVSGSLVTQNSNIQTEYPGEFPILPDTPQDNTDIGDETSPSAPGIDTEARAKAERIRSIKSKYQKHLNDAQLNCIGISDKLGVIQGLATGTTIVSGLGTLAAGGAFASEMINQRQTPATTSKTNTASADASAENQETPVNDSAEPEIEEIAETVSIETNSAASEIKEQNSAEKSGRSEIHTKIENSLLIGSAIASTGGVITSSVALANMDSLISKMKDCKNNIANIKIARAELLEEDVPQSDKTVLQMNDIVSSCSSIDSSSVKNVEQVKGVLIASTITSGVGAAGGVVATVTNTKAQNETDTAKQKKLDLATKISTGVSGGAQAGSLALGITTITKVNKDKDIADDCERALMRY